MFLSFCFTNNKKHIFIAGMTTELMKCCEKHWEWYHLKLKSEVWYQYRTSAVILSLKCFSLRIKGKNLLKFITINAIYLNLMLFNFIFYFLSFSTCSSFVLFLPRSPQPMNDEQESWSPKASWHFPEPIQARTTQQNSHSDPKSVLSGRISTGIYNAPSIA